MLFVVPTPVGNLEDITLRALRVLKEADMILAEDTRQTKKLLDHFEIKRPLQAYHKFNEKASCERIVQQLQTGATIAMVSDGGTPCISDPGFILVEACIEAGIKVQCLPGATAFVPALVNSGFDTSAFVFLGFPPHKKGRETFFKAVAAEKNAVIFYESPFRVVKALEQLQSYISPVRKISISREISKMFEETVRGTCEELLLHFTTTEPRGEFVVVVNSEQKKREDSSSFQ